MSSRFYGLVTRRERWSLSWKGWLLAFILFTGLAAITVASAYSFLHINAPVRSDYLAVEGWLSMWNIKAVAAHLSTNQYKNVFTVGGPISGTGPYVNEFTTDAHTAYVRLKKEGVSDNLLRKVPSKVRDRDRTYGAAVALREWLATNHLAITSLNVITAGPHARRSRLLFQKAFGPNVDIGVIALPPDDYPPEYWYKYSAGVKDLISETAGYLYVRLFFHP